MASVLTLPGPGEDSSGLLDQKAGIEVQDATLDEVLEALEESVGVAVAYSPTLTESRTDLITCYCEELTVDEAAKEMLSGTGLELRAFADQLVLRERADQAPEAKPDESLIDDLRPVGFLAGTRGTAAEAPPVSVTEQRQTGAVEGEVRDQGSGEAVAGVVVRIEETDQSTLSNTAGEFRLEDVPAGSVTVTAEVIGYRSHSQSVQVPPDDTAVVVLELREQALGLDEVVVTGTAGGTERRAIGNVVSSLSADEIRDQTPITQTDQFLGQRSAGVMMLPSTGQVGTSSNPRIRGISSITQGAEPIIYIDGVRMDSHVAGGRSGGPSRLNDINPNDIADIEIIKGPAAATLYGTEASDGVIQIQTRQGQAGEPQFELRSRIGTNWMWNPEERAGLRYKPDPDNPDELIGVNVYEQERVHGDGPVFDYGTMHGHSLSLRGGTDAVRYYASVSRDHDVGIVDHNWERRLGARGNVELLMGDDLTVSLGTSYSQGEIRLSDGLAATAPFRNIVWALPDNEEGRGFRTSPPDVWDTTEDRVDNDRVTVNLRTEYQPVEWTNHRLVAGIDVNREDDWLLVPRVEGDDAQFFGALADGYKSSTNTRRNIVTVDYSGNANIDWRDFTFTPAVGFQYYKQESHTWQAEGQEFPAIPITTISGAASRTGGETFAENATVGVYFQQQVGWRDRAFVTAAVRGDDNSAFGADFDAAIYPKLSGTWLISDEAFWPLDFVEEFRLRSAWGAAGQQPGTFDAPRLFDPAIGYQDQPGLVPGSYGNPELQPERSEELEVGFDASFLGGRLDLEVTRYQRSVKDAIVNRTVPPSSGFTGSQVVNIGQLSAWGNELEVFARAVDGDRFSWDVDLQVGTMENEIESLGDLDVIHGGTQSQHRVGYSVADIFMLRILDAEIDENANVLSATCDGGTGPQGVDPGGDPVPCEEAPQVWLGNSQPTWEVGIGNTFHLFDDLSLHARIEGSGGHIHNATEVRAGHNLGMTWPVLQRDNPVFHAYRAFENDRMGVYDAGFLRLRELSLTYQVPGNWIQRIGAERGSVTLGMRNVAMLWTAEEGWSTPRDGHIREDLGDMIIWDPETRGTGSTSVGFQQNLPQTATATMSISLTF